MEGNTHSQGLPQTSMPQTSMPQTEGFRTKDFASLTVLFALTIRLSLDCMMPTSLEESHLNLYLSLFF